MQISKPKVSRVYVSLKDGETGKTKHFTVYNATPEDVVRRLEAKASKSSKQ